MINQVLLVFIELFVAAFNFLLLARVIGSWVQPDLTANRWTAWLFWVTEPVLAPVRRLLPAMGGLDLSPLVTFFALQLLLNLAVRLL